MNFFESWILRRIIRKLMVQGNHRKNVIHLFVLVREACAREFTEDNSATREIFLQECFDVSRSKELQLPPNTGMVTRWRSPSE
jgi:hypothetical protein